MTIVEVDLNDIRELVGEPIAIDELERMLFDYGMELEEYSGDELCIDITPDRPDMLSKYGLCRALKKYLGIDGGITRHGTEKSDIEITVSPDIAAIRPYIAAALVKNLRIDDDILKELITVQEKLHATFCRRRKIAAIGLYPYHKICPPISYYAEDPTKILFRPLGYDTEMTGYEILQKHETGQEYRFLLEGQDKYPLLVDSEGQVLSMPPIINSEDVGHVEAGTRDIFIEVTGTNLMRIRHVINMLSAMFAEMGGVLYTVTVNYGHTSYITPDAAPTRRELDVRNVQGILGLELSVREISELLARMGYGIDGVENTAVNVLVPYYRADVLHEVDIIDDIARAYGLNTMQATLPVVDTVGGVLKKTKVVNFLREALVGLGFVESFTLALSNVESQYGNMNLESADVISIPNAKSSEMNIVRTWLIPELIRCVKSNEHHSHPIKLFEISDVCARDNSTDTGYGNVKNLAVLIYNTRVTFTDIKQVLDFVMRVLDETYELKRAYHRSFIDGRVGDVISGSSKEKRGIIGELHPEVLKRWRLKNPVSCFEICLEDSNNHRGSRGYL